MMERTKLLEPFQLAYGVMLRNRIAMAPMTTWAGNDDGTVSDEEEAYYRLRAKDVGLVITGCTHVQENGIGFTQGKRTRSGTQARWPDRLRARPFPTEEGHDRSPDRRVRDDRGS